MNGSEMTLDTFGKKLIVASFERFEPAVQNKMF